MISHSSITEALRDLHKPDMRWSHTLTIAFLPTPIIKCWPKHLIDESAQIELLDFFGLLHAILDPVEDWDDDTFIALAEWIYDSLPVWLEDEFKLALVEAKLDEAHNARIEHREPVANPTNDRAETIKKILRNL